VSLQTAISTTTLASKILQGSLLSSKSLEKPLSTLMGFFLLCLIVLIRRLHHHDHLSLLTFFFFLNSGTLQGNSYASIWHHESSATSTVSNISALQNNYTVAFVYAEAGVTQFSNFTLLEETIQEGPCFLLLSLGQVELTSSLLHGCSSVNGLSHSSLLVSSLDFSHPFPLRHCCHSGEGKFCFKHCKF